MHNESPYSRSIDQASPSTLGNHAPLTGQPAEGRPPEEKIAALLDRTTFAQTSVGDTQLRLDPSEVDARLNDNTVSLHELYTLRLEAATEAARAGDIDRMYQLLDPRRNGRFLRVRTSAAIGAPGPRAIILAEAVKAGHQELYPEMVKNARKAVGTNDNKVDAYLAAAEAGWDEGISKAQELIYKPAKLGARGHLLPHVSAAKGEEAERRIAKILASRSPNR